MHVTLLIAAGSPTGLWFCSLPQALHGLLEEAARGSRGPLFELAQQLDFSGYYSKLAGARQ